MNIQTEHKGIAYSVTEKGGRWNWRVYYPKSLGEFDYNGWAPSEADAERDAKAAIDKIVTSQQAAKIGQIRSEGRASASYAVG